MRIFIGFSAFVIWWMAFSAYRRHSANRKRVKSIEAFLEEEREANESRKKEIEPEYRYEPDLTLLPELSGDSKQEENVKKFARRNMLRFPKRYTNIELKKAYGPSQLEDIARCEENFNSYVLSLIEWAELCADTGRQTDAVAITEHAISLGSEYRKGYRLIARLYLERGEEGKLDSLIKEVDGRNFADEGAKRLALKAIMDAKCGIGGGGE